MNAETAAQARAHRYHSLVFAYGSNMCSERIRARVPSARRLTIGYVSRRQIVFHKRSVDGSAKADAAFTGRAVDRVWGVVFRLTAADKRVLDRHEFLGTGYDETVVDVVHQTGRLSAWMYVARQEAIDVSLLPYCWYHAFILQGANQHGLPAAYRRYLQAFATVPDPDRERGAANRRLLSADRRGGC